MLDWNFIASQIATIAFDIVYFGAIIGTIVVNILDNRNPVKTMAWILILMFLPIVGLVFYFFFGRSQRRVRMIGKKSYSRLLKKPMAEYLAQDSCALPINYSRLISLFRNTNQAFPFDGNRVEAYTLGLSMLQSLLRELGKATKHIHMEFYIFEDDAIGRLVRDVLMEKARAGVEVRVIYDDVGCWHVPNRFFEEMREAGIEAVLVAMQTAALSGVDVRLMLPMRADNRLTHLGSCSYLADVLYSGVKVYFYKKGFLHSKLMVSDDELSTVGSTNVDFRSFEHNFEVNAFIYDTETALQMREIFLQDQRDCVQVFLKNWVKRPWYRKAAERVVRLMAPLL